jgi:hypothetical protein
MTQYLHYLFNQNSATIKNYGAAAAGSYDGQAVRNQYGTNSKGHPIWGPMTGAKDGIVVPSGISNPYQHTWQIGLNIARWWPVNGVVDGMLVGNDGKLWSAADDQFYGYIHEGCSWDGSTLTQLGYYFLTVEIQGASYLDVEFYLGVGANRPVKIQPDSPGNEGALYQGFSNASLKLNTNYYMQIAVSSDGPTSGAYVIGNCTGPGCNDASNCGGFPCGAYIYSWREDNTVLDLAGGGNWADDVGLWTGSAVPATPNAAVAAVVKCPCKHIWCGVTGAPTTSLYSKTVNVNDSVSISGAQGWVTQAGGWIANKPDATTISIVQKDPAGNLTTIGTVKPNAKGNFSATIPSPKKTGVYHYNAKGASGNWGHDIVITWGGIVSLTSAGWEGSTPAACVPDANELAVFIRGTDSKIYFKQQEKGVWGVWRGIGGLAYSGAGVGVASWGAGRMDAFVTGYNNTVYYANNASGWIWTSIGAISTSSVCAVSDQLNHVMVLARGSDGACWYKLWNGSVWGDWISLGGGMLANTGPAACSRGANLFDVFVTGTNGAVYHKSYSGGVWTSTWEDLTAGGFQTTASAAAAAQSSTQLAVFAQGSNGHLYMLEWNDGAWDAAWLELGGQLATGTGPGACSDGTNYHVFVTGTDAQVYHTYGNGSVWYAWENLGGKDSIDASEPAAQSGGIIPTGTGGAPGGPITTPPSPQDLTLVPITPVPTAMPAGISVVLRDHKKAPPTGGT